MAAGTAGHDERREHEGEDRWSARRPVHGPDAPPVLGTDDRPDHRPGHGTTVPATRRWSRGRDAEAEDEAAGSASSAPDGVVLDDAFIRAAETAEPSARARMLTERRRHEEPEP